MPNNFAGMPSILVLLLVQTGLPGVALTLTFGQLVMLYYFSILFNLFFN